MFKILKTKKFRNNNTLKSSEVSYSDNTKIIECNGELDTQSFVEIDNFYVLAHHQFHKVKNHGPIEIYNSGSDEPFSTLEDTEDLLFPTSLATNGSKLAVSANGENFKSKIKIYTYLGEKKFKLSNTFNFYDEDKIRPIGLAFDDYILYVCSYSGQKVWQINLKTGDISLALNIERFGQTTPICVTPTKNSLIVLGHVDGSIVEYSKKYKIPIRIKRDGLSYPWSLIKEKENYVISNIGKKNKFSQNSYITSLDTNFDEISEVEGRGATILRL